MLKSEPEGSYFVYKLVQNNSFNNFLKQLNAYTEMPQASRKFFLRNRPIPTLYIY